MDKQSDAQGSEKVAEEKQLDEKELERKLKKDQKAKEKEEKKLKAKQKEAARLQAQATSDGTKKAERKQRKKAVEDENPQDFIDPNTPNGRKKLLAPQMAKQYSPSAVERSWYAWWESSGYFGADSASTKPPFVIVSDSCS
uniref:valine--tRNA ligase n=1 Tax=Zea mays TaxID=4577 RepID=A0A804RID5_MAIZE